MSLGGFLTPDDASRDMIVRDVTPPGSFGKVFGFVTTASTSAASSPRFCSAHSWTTRSARDLPYRRGLLPDLDPDV